jgi:hypothetical protein
MDYYGLTAWFPGMISESFEAAKTITNPYKNKYTQK